MHPCTVVPSIPCVHYIVGYTKFSNVDGWCSDGGGILKNREDIYRSLEPSKKRGKKNTF